MKKITLTFFCAVISLLLNAQPGTLDSSFGENGKVLNETFQGVAYTMVIQPDGKIIAGGVQYGEKNGFLVARYNTDGSLDNTFGDSGRAVNNLGDIAFSKIIYAIALQKDGKIVATGQYANTGDNSSIALMRFNKDGSIDKEFGDEGITLTFISGYYDIVRDLGILPNGDIILTGDTEENPNDNRRSFLASYNTAGKLNETFGNNGILLISFEDVSDIKALSITVDGKIVIGGSYVTLRKSIILRYNGNGSPDNTFGNNGFTELPFNVNTISFAQLNDIAVNADNSVVATGYIRTRTSLYSNVLAEKFLSDGRPDSSFGTNGYALISVDKSDAYANAVTSASDGKITTGGYFNNKGNGGFLLTGFNSNGTPDSAFGTNGIETTVFEGSSIAYCAAMQDDGKIILAGTTTDFTIPSYQVTLTRYKGTESIQAKYVRIKRWLHHHGFTWEDQPGNHINYYSIQRSSNNNSFTEIARIVNRGNNQQSYEDASAATGSYSYRVAAVSTTGNITYSNTLTINDNTTNIKVFPNPVKNSLQIAGLPANVKTKLTVTDLTGTVRIATTINSSNYTLNVAQLTKGNYIIKIESSDAVVTKQFIKE